MAKVRKKRKGKLKKQSLAKNVALLLLSIAILTGASVLFTTLNTRPEYSYDTIEKNLSKIVSKAPDQAVAQAEKEKPDPQKSSAGGGFEYSYWDILLLPDKNAPETESFTIQIGAFKTREAAQQLADEINDKTRLRCQVEARGKTFLVRWGTFHTKEMAQRYCSSLESKIQRNCAVVKL